MNIIQLEYFNVVAREQHMTKAANKLHITQPALSAAINHIENEVGYKMFDRIGRQIILNENGRIFLEHTKVILDSYYEALSSLAEINSVQSKTLSLAVTGIEAPQPIIQGFREQHPDINIKQFLIHTDELASMFSQNSLDFVFSSILPENPAADSCLILDEQLMIVLPSSHPLAQREGIYLSEVKQEPFIAMPQKTAFRHLTDDVCRQAGFSPNTILEVYSSQLTDFVEHGNAVTIIASFSMPKHASKGQFKILPLLDPFCKYKIYLLWKKRNTPHKGLQKLFYDFTIENGNALISSFLSTTSEQS